MKKILAIILVFLTSCNVVFAQSSYPRWHGDELFYPHLTTLGSTSWIMVNNNGQTSVISGTALASFLGAGSTLTSQTNTWSANQTHTAGIIFGTNGFLQLPNALVGTTSRQPYFDLTDSTLYITDALGNSIPFKSQSYNDNTYATSEGATNLGSTYMTLATSQTVTGLKIFSNEIRATNKQRIPYGTLPEVFTAGYIMLNSANNYYPYVSNSNGTWQQIVTLGYLQANYPAISNYAYSTGSQTLNPVWTFNGTLNAIGGKVKIKESTTLESNEVGFESTQGSAGIYVGSSVYAPADNEVQDMIESKVNYTPYTIPASAIDIGLNYNVYQKTVSTETTFTFSNTTNKRLELWVTNSGLSYIHFTAPSGYTIVYPDGFNQPFTGLHLYDIKIYNTKIFITKIMTTSL